MVVLSKIYTKTGDAGRTRLANMTEVTKNDLRVEAYGDVDEANAALGVALATGGLPDQVAAVLRIVTNEMFDVGADLSNPLRPLQEGDPEPLRVTPEYVDRLETWCDRFGDELPTLRSFILPGGTMAAAQLHVARTVTRRAERAGWAAVAAYGTEPRAEGEGGVNVAALLYLNRLSDLLFILIRVVNGPEGDILWVPGGDRVHD